MAMLIKFNRNILVVLAATERVIFWMTFVKRTSGYVRIQMTKLV